MLAGRRSERSAVRGRGGGHSARYAGEKAPQKYKVGKYILETIRVVGYSSWEDVEVGEGEEGEEVNDDGWDESYYQIQQDSSRGGKRRAAAAAGHAQHQRGQSVVSPQDLLLTKGDNKRKRSSWDGGAR